MGDRLVELRQLMDDFKAGKNLSARKDGEGESAIKRDSAYQIQADERRKWMEAKYPESEWCNTCYGMGFVSIRTNPDDDESMNFESSPCPDNCKAAQRERRNALQRMLKGFGDIPGRYSEFTFDTWIHEVPDPKKSGKEIAFLATQYLATHPMQSFSMMDLFGWARETGKFPALKSYQLIPPTYQDRDKQPETWEEQVHLKIGNNEPFQIMNSVGNGIVLSSKLKGTGKTGLAVSTAYALIEAGYAVAFIHLPTWLDSIKSTYNKDYNGKSRYSIIAPVEKSDILIVDEFNVAYKQASEHDITMIENHIITPRWSAGEQKPMLITTNNTPSDMVNMWGDLASDRIFEFCHWVNLSGKIRRTNRPVG